MWRIIQAHAFPHRKILQHSHPHLFSSPQCPNCGALDTHYHSLCQCPKDPYPPLPTPQAWEQALRSSEVSDQVLVTSRALQVAAALWATATAP